MDTKYAIVVDSSGNKVKFVAIETIEEGVSLIEKPHAYTLKPGEKLIYENIPVANSMIKARWNGLEWEETATPEEIEAVKPQPTLSIPTIEERQTALERAFMELAGEIYG